MVGWTSPRGGQRDAANVFLESSAPLVKLYDIRTPTQVALPMFKGAVSYSLSSSRSLSGSATAMRDMHAAIVRMSVQVADVKKLADEKNSLLSLTSAAKAPSAFWVRLLVVSSVDPAVQSTATAFKVVPLTADVDGLKDAVAAKMRLSVAAPLLEVWAHDAASNRWVTVDEDSALVANDKATTYHVVVPS